MEGLNADILGLLATTAGFCFAMMWLAARLNLIESRREGRCPACGLIRRRGVCRCSR